MSGRPQSARDAQRRADAQRKARVRAEAARLQAAGERAWRNAKYAEARDLFGASVRAREGLLARPSSAPPQRFAGEIAHERDVLLHKGNRHEHALAEAVWDAYDVRDLRITPLAPTEVPMDRWTKRVYRSLEITPTDLGPDRTGVEKCKAKMKKDNVAEVVFSTPSMGRLPRSDAHSMLSYTRPKKKACLRARSAEGQRHFLKRNQYSDFVEKRLMYANFESNAKK